MNADDAAGADLTIEQLAARVGMTVRNVRAYSARGLLPPPRLVARTGYYGHEHVQRLVLVRDLMAQGYTLAAVEQAVAQDPTASSASALALRRVLMTPWLPAAPQVTTLADIAMRAEADSADALAGDLADLGLIEELEDGRVRVLDPELLEAGIDVVRLGIPPAVVVRVQRQVIELVQQAADLYVEMFRETVWQRFVDDDCPPEGWADITATVHALQPLAARALLASFRAAMAAAVADEISRDVDVSGAPAPPS